MVKRKAHLSLLNTWSKIQTSMHIIVPIFLNYTSTHETEASTQLEAHIEHFHKNALSVQCSHRHATDYDRDPTRSLVFSHTMNVCMNQA